MYFVDREKIEAILTFMTKLHEHMTSLTIKSELDAFAFERLLHLTIEAILDTGNAMIDGFIMRDPGSYEDIIDILCDEKVIHDEESVGLKEIIRFRKSLVQDYIDVDRNEMLSTYRRQADHVKQFPLNVKKYLDNELGPVSAFRH